MAQIEAGNVVPLVEAWLVWDWFIDDAKDGEQDGRDKDTGKVSSNPPPEESSR